MQQFDDYQTFEASIQVARLEDTGNFVAQVTIRCKETGEIMELADDAILAGISTRHVCTNPFRDSIDIPIRPPLRVSSDTKERWEDLTREPAYAGPGG